MVRSFLTAHLMVHGLLNLPGATPIVRTHVHFPPSIRLILENLLMDTYRGATRASLYTGYTRTVYQHYMPTLVERYIMYFPLQARTLSPMTILQETGSKDRIIVISEATSTSNFHRIVETKHDALYPLLCLQVFDSHVSKYAGRANFSFIQSCCMVPANFLDEFYRRILLPTVSPESTRPRMPLLFHSLKTWCVSASPTELYLCQDIVDALLCWIHLFFLHHDCKTDKRMDLRDAFSPTLAVLDPDVPLEPGAEDPNHAYRPMERGATV
jgi:hypothetical protein